MLNIYAIKKAIEMIELNETVKPLSCIYDMARQQCAVFYSIRKTISSTSGNLTSEGIYCAVFIPNKYQALGHYAKSFFSMKVVKHILKIDFDPDCLVICGYSKISGENKFCCGIFEYKKSIDKYATIASLEADGFETMLVNANIFRDTLTSIPTEQLNIDDHKAIVKNLKDKICTMGCWAA